MVSVLLFASVERFSVSRMRDCSRDFSIKNGYFWTHNMSEKCVLLAVSKKIASGQLDWPPGSKKQKLLEIYGMTELFSQFNTAVWLGKMWPADHV